MDFGILEALLIPEVATEADDITKQVNDIMGGKTAPTEKESNDQREEDLTKTDNLFDDINKDSNEDNPQDNPSNNDDNNSSNDGNSDNNDNPDASNNDDQNNSDDSDPNNTDDQNMDDPSQMNPDDSSMNPEDKSVFSDKNTLKKNMIYFFNIIRYTITSLEASLGGTEDQITIRVINSVIHNLYSAKDVMYEILTKEMESTPYETLTAKYITLKRIYDISCDMLEEHFKEHPNTRVKYKRFKNKSK